MASKLLLLLVTFRYWGAGRRAVNQAMGRVIRHISDFGAIILADERFSKGSARSEISCWLRDRVVDHANFGSASRSLDTFFKVSDTRGKAQDVSQSPDSTMSQTTGPCNTVAPAESSIGRC